MLYKGRFEKHDNGSYTYITCNNKVIMTLILNFNYNYFHIYYKDEWMVIHNYDDLSKLLPKVRKLFIVAAEYTVKKHNRYVHHNLHNLSWYLVKN
jgi:hypothetical protein